MCVYGCARARTCACVFCVNKYLLAPSSFSFILLRTLSLSLLLPPLFVLFPSCWWLPCKQITRIYTKYLTKQLENNWNRFHLSDNFEKIKGRIQLILCSNFIRITCTANIKLFIQSSLIIRKWNYRSSRSLYFRTCASFICDYFSFYMTFGFNHSSKQ